jgi:hypothetical protein
VLFHVERWQSGAGIASHGFVQLLVVREEKKRRTVKERRKRHEIDIPRETPMSNARLRDLLNDELKSPRAAIRLCPPPECQPK